MAMNKDMLHGQTTHGLFNDACKVFDGVSKLKEKIAELNAENEKARKKIDELLNNPCIICRESNDPSLCGCLIEENKKLKAENESLKNNVATLETDIAMAESWRTSTPPVGVELLLETGDGFWRVRFNNKEKVDYLVNEGTIKRWIPFPKTIG